MKMTELRDLSKEDLLSKRESLKSELNKLNYKKIVGQMEKPHQFKALRKSIARINTLLSPPRQKE